MRVFVLASIHANSPIQPAVGPWPCLLQLLNLKAIREGPHFALSGRCGRCILALLLLLLLLLFLLLLCCCRARALLLLACRRRRRRLLLCILLGGLLLSGLLLCLALLPRCLLLLLLLLGSRLLRRLLLLTLLLLFCTKDSRQCTAWLGQPAEQSCRQRETVSTLCMGGCRAALQPGRLLLPHSAASPPARAHTHKHTHARARARLCCPLTLAILLLLLLLAIVLILCHRLLAIGLLRCRQSLEITALGVLQARGEMRENGEASIWAGSCRVGAERSPRIQTSAAQHALPRTCCFNAHPKKS